jgi:hypothetical protein
MGNIRIRLFLENDGVLTEGKSKGIIYKTAR